MDRYRSLYKDNSSMLTPSQHSRVNRELQNANRAKNRRQMFQSSRNIDVSPTPRKIHNAQETIRGNGYEKENIEGIVDSANGVKTCFEPKAPTNDCNKSRIALVATSKENSKKLTKQEAFLLKFIEWKEAHKLKEQKKNEPKKRPFVPSGGVGGKTFGNNLRATSVSSNIKNNEVAAYVPKGHKQFKPPAGLKNPMVNMTSAARDVFANDRKSLYTVVPTPPRKEQVLKKATTALSKTPAISNLTRINPNITPAVGALKTKPNFSSTKISTTKTDATIPRITSKPTAIIKPNKNTIGRVLTYPSSTATTTTAACGIQKTVSTIDTKLVAKEPIKNNTCNVNKYGINDNKENKNRLNIAHKFKQPQVPKAKTTIAQKPVPRTKVNCGPNTITNTLQKQKPPTIGIVTGAVGKAHLLQNKRAAAASAVTNPPQQRNAKLTTTFKAKKTQVSKFNRPNAPSKITIKGKTLLGTCKTDTAFAIAETPTDLLNINPYEPLVTSTRIKSLSPHTTKAPNLSPINKEVDIATTAKNLKPQETHKNNNIRAQHSSASAKRTLLQNEVKLTRDVQAKQPKQILKQKSKFNFVRYSVGLSELDTSAEVTINNGNEDAGEEGEEKNEVDATKQQLTVLEVQTEVEVNLAMSPVSGTNFAPHEIANSNEAERPVNYVGSFVSVSRGKVSARKEREKRDSVYVPSADNTLIATTPTPITPIKTSKQKAELVCESTIATTTTTPLSIEARRMLEAVRYFRQQLNNEIQRLHALCDQWDEYKQEHLEHLQQTGGEDMINVTIGQTKLLTSKKFQQFRGLIDRCESGARGSAPAYDGSEDTKPISDVDLEGFWSMLSLQVDNIEKRFENLKRWKANNWSDPEDVQQQTNKQAKQKAKPNLTKVNKKTKAPAKTAKASSGLQAMLRKMHAEMRKNKQAGTGTNTNTDVELILTPTKTQRQRRSHSGTPKSECINGGEQRSSTPRRVSVVVRDRKSLSAAATVISLPADNAVVSAVAAQRRLSRTLTGGCETPKSFKACGSELRRSLSKMERTFGDCTDLLRTALTTNAQQKARHSGTPNFIESPLDTDVKQQQQVRAYSPPPQSTPPTAVAASRKSILKTPGTVKGKPKNVIFSEKCRVKKFKFTREDDRLSDDEELRMQTSTEEPLEDDQKRTYSLRTRKVVLRPSSEFEIPKA